MADAKFLSQPVTVAHNLFVAYANWWCDWLLVTFSLQALEADTLSTMNHCTLLLLGLSETDPAAAASAVAQPLLQLLGPAVKHCLQQQQQQQQGAASHEGLQGRRSLMPQNALVVGFLEVLRTVLTQSERQVMLDGSDVVLCALARCITAGLVTPECVLRGACRSSSSKPSYNLLFHIRRACPASTDSTQRHSCRAISRACLLGMLSVLVPMRRRRI
jgi:hypothetical protein